MGGFCYSQTKPNVLLILLDDARFDSFSPNGGPDFFNDSSISRIANEGVNFSNSYCVYSLCVPSRASLLTGLYPHKNGARNNGFTPDSTLIQLQSILKTNGYRTGFVGKYDWATDPQQGWDYWFASIGEDYSNAQFNYNGVVRSYFGHKTDIITDSAVGFLLDEPADTPFFLMVSHLAPHTPFQPRQQDDSLYDSIPMPIPDNFYFFQHNYPSFLRDFHFYIQDTIDLDTTLRLYYQMLAGVEASVQRIFSKLTSRNFLDNTMVIFTSDNGHLWGEHQLQVKRLAYEESSKVPLFIRFPAWFPISGIVNDQFALNVDLAPTILDAAGIDPSVYNFDGISLKQLYDGSVNRSSIYYEVLSNETLPALRQVRDKNYAYTYYYCDGLTEEFFDLNKDPEENENQILNSNYQQLIQLYKERLDSFKVALNDTIVESVHNCYLEDTLYLANGSSPKFPFTLNYSVLPGEVNVQLYAPSPVTISISLVNMLGQVVYAKTDISIMQQQSLSINTSNLTIGSYLLVAQGNQLLGSAKILIGNK